MPANNIRAFDYIFLLETESSRRAAGDVILKVACPTFGFLTVKSEKYVGYFQKVLKSKHYVPILFVVIIF